MYGTLYVSSGFEMHVNFIFYTLIFAHELVTSFKAFISKCLGNQDVMDFSTTHLWILCFKLIYTEIVKQHRSRKEFTAGNRLNLYSYNVFGSKILRGFFKKKGIGTTYVKYYLFCVKYVCPEFWMNLMLCLETSFKIEHLDMRQSILSPWLHSFTWCFRKLRIGLCIVQFLTRSTPFVHLFVPRLPSGPQSQCPLWMRINWQLQKTMTCFPKALHLQYSEKKTLVSSVSLFKPTRLALTALGSSRANE